MHQIAIPAQFNQLELRSLRRMPMLLLLLKPGESNNLVFNSNNSHRKLLQFYPIHIIA